MGSLNLPASGRVYLDTQCLIYTIESHPVYQPLLRPIWAAAQAGAIQIVMSEITILEALAGPYKSGDTGMELSYERAIASPVIELIPISPDILRAAARLRASTTQLRTPDAIHAATALASSIALFVTNDFAFRNVTGLSVEVLQDVLTRP